MLGHISHDIEKGSKVVAEIDEVVGENGHVEEEIVVSYLKILIHKTEKSPNPQKVCSFHSESV